MRAARGVRLVFLPALAAGFMALGSAVALGDPGNSTAPPASTAADAAATDAGSGALPQQDLTPNPPQSADSGYGTGTAVSGDTALIGAPNDGTTGSVSVFTFDGDGTASQQATLTPSAASAQSGFGTAVATDGATIVVGAPGNASGEAVDLYDPDTYALLVSLLGADAFAGDGSGFGSAVAVSGDWLVVGAPQADGSGAVFIYLRKDGAWGADPFQSLFGAVNSSFGKSVAIDGLTIVVGAPHDAIPASDVYPDWLRPGSVHVFTFAGDAAGGSWIAAGNPLYDPDPIHDEGFGSAVAIEGTTIGVGAPNPGVDDSPGRVVVFTDPYGPGAQAPQTIGIPGDGSQFGRSVALDGTNLAIGYLQSDLLGAVGIYSHSANISDSTMAGGGYGLVGTQTGTGNGYGQSLGFSGRYLVVGGGGHAYLVNTDPGATPPSGATPSPGGPGPGKVGGVHVGGVSAPGFNPLPASAPAPVQPTNVTPSPAGHPRGNFPKPHEKTEAPVGTQPHGEIDRSSFAERVLAPTQLDLSFTNLAQGGFLAFLLAALLYLPVIIFNKTTEHNHDKISGWLAGPRRRLAALTALLPMTQHPLMLLLATGVVSACLFSFVEPGFPHEPGSLEYLIGMIIGFLVVATVFFLTWRQVVHRLEPESQGRWRLYPPYIVLAAGLVILARLAHFLPGVVLGTLAEYEPGKKLSRRTAGLRVLVTYSTLLVLGGAAWLAWIPVEHAASKEGASSLTLILDAALAVTFVTGLESVVFGLIPLKFLDGNDLFAWHKGAWLALWGVGLYWFSVVILHPALSTYNEVSSAGAFWFGVLFSSLMLVALATWGYFRVRAAREARLGDSAAG
jgi:FG-GAP repeat